MLLFMRVFLILLLLWLSSCQKQLDSVPPENEVSYQDYFPKTIGHWVDYKVDSFHYVKSSLDPAPIVTGTTYYIREWIEDTLHGFGLPYQYKIKVLFRKTPSEPWAFLRNISMQPLKDEVTNNENNLRFTKLQSPIKSSMSWKGNKYIDTSVNKIYGEWNYRYMDIFQSKQVSGFNFDNTVTVLQHLDSNAIEKTHFFEVYAKNIGLIHAEKHVLAKQTPTNGWDKPENGFSVIIKVVDWKK